jgi:hypothetical protein
MGRQRLPSSADAELGLDAEWRPETCAALCRPPTAADAHAEAERLAEALPAVPTKEADYLLLRRVVLTLGRNC